MRQRSNAEKEGGSNEAAAAGAKQRKQEGARKAGKHFKEEGKAGMQLEAEEEARKQQGGMERSGRSSE